MHYATEAGKLANLLTELGADTDLIDGYPCSAPLAWTAAARGRWDIGVEDGDPATLTGAFSVGDTGGTVTTLTVRLDGLERLRVETVAALLSTLAGDPAERRDIALE